MQAATVLAEAGEPLPAGSWANESWPLSVSRCTPVIGAEIDGVDLTRPLDDDTYAALRTALLKFKVLFFRD